MAHWSDEYLQICEDCENRDSRLTDWEQTFIDSVKRQIENGKPPTPKQIEILDRVWEKVTAKR